MSLRPLEHGERPALQTAVAFDPKDWAFLSGTALTWGSSFVLIEVALDAFEPGLIAFLRILFGALAVVWFRRARAPVERRDRPTIALVGLLWMAAPFLLFPLAQQSIDSSLAGMINGAVPLFAATVATTLSRKLPARSHLAGLVVGFGGVALVSLPAIQGTSSSAAGAALVLLASICYGIALNLVTPLQRKYGSLPVLLRVQGVALVLMLVPALLAARDSAFAWPSLAAVVPLGALGTGLAFVWMATLAGRVGPARAAVTIYFVPIVAIVLGAVFRDEAIAVVELLGTALVLFGAYLTSRREEPGRHSTRASVRTP